MILRPRALVAEPSTWLAALICCGLCALAWFGYRATDQWQRSAALLADHRGREAADLLTRALTRDMSGVQTSILNSPEQNRHAFDPPYEANDLVALAFARYPYPEFFFGWTPSSGGTVMFARTDRLPAWITRARASRRLSRRGPSRSAGNRGAAAAGRIGHRRAPPLFGLRHVNRRDPLPGRRAPRLRGHDAGTARPCVRRRRQPRVGPRPLFQRHPAAGRADRREHQRDVFCDHR